MALPDANHSTGAIHTYRKGRRQEGSADAEFRASEGWRDPSPTVPGDPVFGDPSPTADLSPIAAISEDFSESTARLFSAGGINETSATVVDLAVATIAGCAFAGIFLQSDGFIRTTAATDPILEALDSLQHKSGEGPCLDAMTSREVCYAADLSTDSRWPLFAPEAANAGIRSALAVPLTVGGQLGTLNLFAHHPGAFGAIEQARAGFLSTLSGFALAMARSQEEEERRAASFAAALATRESIGEALGILMERERITADRAFEVLSRASQHLNVKLRYIAEDLIATGEIPEIGRGRIRKSDSSSSSP